MPLRVVKQNTVSQAGKTSWLRLLNGIKICWKSIRARLIVRCTGFGESHSKCEINQHSSDSLSEGFRNSLASRAVNSTAGSGLSFLLS